MLEHLIRPVSLIIEPENIGRTTCTNKPSFLFPVPPEFGVSIKFGQSFINSEVNVDIAEISINKTVLLAINAQPYNSFMDLAHAEISYYGEIRGHKVLNIDHTDPLFLEYATEQPSRLSLVEDGKYRFIVGQKKYDVFVDRWLKDSQSPSWRIKIPTTKNKYSRRVVVSSARLLIFDSSNNSEL